MLTVCRLNGRPAKYSIAFLCPSTTPSSPSPPLTLSELYALLQLRSEVFVVEQTCAFQDIDGHDQEALHLLGHNRGGRAGGVCAAVCGGAQLRAGQHWAGADGAAPPGRRAGPGRCCARPLRSARRSLGGSPSRLGRSSICGRFMRASGLWRRARGTWKTGFRMCPWCGRSQSGHPGAVGPGGCPQFQCWY